MLAEEACALGGHETRNMTCCGKHLEEIPCATCMGTQTSVKEAQPNEEQEKSSQPTNSANEIQ